MNKLDKLNIKIYADGADKAGMFEMNNKNFIQGLTTNPTLMRKAGIVDYEAFCKDILKTILVKPISFEVFADDFLEMEKQALKISSWGNNVYVKLPITNTKKEPCYELAKRLSRQNVKLNITAIMTLKQVEKIIEYLNPNVNSYISIFAGRIADTGIDPVPLMCSAIKILKDYKNFELIWASPRELLNIFQANDIGCHIITLTNDLIQKFPLIGYPLESYSLDTVKMFYKDALASDYKLNLN